MKDNFIVPLLTLLLGGGFAAAILNLVRAKNESKKAPVDRDAVIVNSAESAVVIMQKVLDATTKQLALKEQEVDDLTNRLAIVKQELANLRDRCNELEELLNSVTISHKATRSEGA